MEEVEIAVLAEPFCIMVSVQMLTFGCLLGSLSLVVVAVLAHPFSVVFQVSMLTLSNLFPVLSKKSRLHCLPVYFSNEEN